MFLNALHLALLDQFIGIYPRRVVNACDHSLPNVVFPTLPAEEGKNAKNMR